MSDPVSSGSNTGDGSEGEGSQRVVVVGPDGSPMGTAHIPSGSGPAEDTQEQQESVENFVEEPAKVMRIGTMIKQLLEEVRAAPLDEASRNRVRDIHQTSMKELQHALAPELRDEMERLIAPFTAETTPSDAELRIAQAQLVGWLEGLFHGIQTALFAQQMAARVQLEQMRRGLPVGTQPSGSTQAPGSQAPSPGIAEPGQYL